MTSPDLARLADALAAAHEDDSRRVPAGDLAALTLEDASHVQALVMERLGVSAAACKVGINPAGHAFAAPIFAKDCVDSGGRLPFPKRGLMGLEVEIAFRLRADLTPEIAAAGEAAVLEVIDQFLVGIEVVGSRLDDHTKAGPAGTLADNFSNAGYAWSFAPAWTKGTDLEGVTVEIEADGKVIHNAPAKHPLGAVMKPVLAYGAAPFDHFGAFKAGMVVTTGSLCGIVPLAAPAEVTARLGGSHRIDLTLA